MRTLPHSSLASSLLRAGAALVALAAAGAAQRSSEPIDYTSFPRAGKGPVEGEFHGPAQWTEREVEHLLNRAAFGARGAEIRAWAKRTPAELVEDLLQSEDDHDPFYVATPRVSRDLLRSLAPGAKRALAERLREADRRQFHAFVSWWFDRMLRGPDPLRERMTLFWHGFFTSSMDVVKRSSSMIRQNELLRDHALESYATTLRAILRDPAMLVYLDNDESRKEHPNENLARELLELFTLGEGNYSERDVSEAARALTGRTVDRGEYVFDVEGFDGGTKRVFGRTGRIGGNQLADLILANPACSRWVSGRLIEWFEGVKPSPERVQSYADVLVESEYQMRPFLRRLFLDPEFYRAEVMGARVSSPVEYMVGTARRLGIEPPPALLAAGARMLGQALLEPPSVKGWEEGLAWITTSSLMLRGNLAGAMLGVVDPELVAQSEADEALEMAEESEPSMEESSMAMVAMAEDEDRFLEEAMFDEETPEMIVGDEMDALEPPAPLSEREERAFEKELGGTRGSFPRVVRVLEKIGYVPNLNLTARLSRTTARSDREIVIVLAEELLAIEPPVETLARLARDLARERELLDVPEGELLSGRVDPEPLLRRLAHLVLSLPEAQLE